MVIKKLHKRIKKYLSSPEHTRTVSLIALLIIIVAIPLTVVVVQSQQDIREHAADPTTGFKQALSYACGEILSAPAEGALEGDIVFRGPIRTADGWQTHKSDGDIINTIDMYKKIVEGWPEREQDKAIEEFNIACNLRFRFGGDCKVELPKDASGKKIGSDGNELPQGQTITMHISSDAGSSSGCDQAVIMRARYGSSPPADYPNVTPFQWPPTGNNFCTDSDGGIKYDQQGLITNNQTACNNFTERTYVDSCNGSTLTEYYCSPDHIAYATTYSCPSGCSEGACTSSTPLPTGVLPTGVQPTLPPTNLNDSFGPTPTPDPSCSLTGTPTVTATPVVSGTITPTVTQGVTPTDAATTPTVTSTPTLTPTPSLTPMPTRTPTPSLTPTPTLPLTPTQFSVTILTPGVGGNGNTAPNNMLRPIYLQLLDASKKAVGASVSGKLEFNGTAFTGTLNFGTIVPNGQYIAKVKMNQYLVKTIASNSAVIAGTTNTLPQVVLIPGDVNNDNKLDILDYNIIVGCFGTKINSDACGIKKVDADLNDDAIVDGVDYNLFLRGLRSAKQGD